MFLPRTHDALIELAANSQFAVGVHSHDQIRTGQMGIPLGSVEFDPYKHEVTDIDLLSVMGEATGEHYVNEVLPNKPVNINVLTDYQNTGDIPKISSLKKLISFALTETIEGALPSITDRQFNYSFGPLPEDVRTTNTPESLASETEEQRAESIKGLCVNGLTLIISDFRNFPAAYLLQNELSDAVAIKVNHPAQLKIPANVGVISLGKGVEVNTNIPASLNIVNSHLATQREKLLTNLGYAGLSVVEVVYDPKQPSKFDDTKTDSDLAEALNAYAKSN